MKVFMTGATGFVGRHIASRLIQDRRQVTCLVRRRDSDSARYLSGLGAELAAGDILDAESMAAGARGADALVHLVGIIFERQGVSFEDIHYQGTMNALAAASVAGVSRFVHMSALGTGPDAESVYHRTKWAAEEAVRASGLPFTIFRPSTIYGPGGDFIHMLASQVKILPVVPVIGDGRYRMQPIWVDDVAACFSACLDRPGTVGRTYELGGPQQLIYDEMIDTICRVLGKSRFKIHIPVALVRPVAWLSERMQSQPLLTTDQLKMLLNDNICDISAMQRELGVDPVPFAQGLKAMGLA